MGSLLRVLELLVLASTCQFGTGVGLLRESAAKHHIGRGSRGDDVTQTLQDVVTSLTLEETKAQAAAKASQGACKDNEGNLTRSINEGDRLVDKARVELVTAQEEVSGLQDSSSGIQAQLKAAKSELDSLAQRLNVLRADRAAQQQKDRKASAEVKALLAKAQERIDEAWKREQTKRAAVKAAALIEDGRIEDQEIYDISSRSAADATDTGLEESSLLQDSFGLFNSDREEGADSEDTARSLQEPPAAAVLRDDAEKLAKAQQAAQVAFEAEEQKLVELLKLQQKKIVGLEDSLAAQQPGLADKYRQMSEANRTIADSQRGIERDRVLLAETQQRCKLITSSATAHQLLRREALQNLQLAQKLLGGKVASSSFLSASRRHLHRTHRHKLVGSFVQIAAVAGPQPDASDDDLNEALQEALAEADAASADVMLLPDTIPMGPESGGAELMLSSEEQSPSAPASSDAAGPFDQVKSMIKALMAAIQEQQNTDAGRNRFCDDGLEKGRQSRLAAKSAAASAEADVRTANLGLKDLEAQEKVLLQDVARLEQAERSATSQGATEGARVQAETDNHKSMQSILVKVRNVISSTKCAFSTVAEAPVSAESCGSAERAVGDAMDTLDKLDQAAKQYINSLTALCQTAEASSKRSRTSSSEALLATRTMRARRANELIVAETARGEAKKNLDKIEEAQRQLESSCAPRPTSLEDKARTRAEEIKSLRNALTVLEGEDVLP